MSQAAARFVWHELITTDVPAAKAFYASVVGWDLQEFEANPGYWVVSAGGIGVGGLMAIPPQALARQVPPCWTGYIGVADVDAHVARVVAAGGAVLQAAQDIPHIGRFAVVADPQGAGFILFAGQGEPPAPAAMGTPGLVGWNELMAADGATAFAWYADLFGWTACGEVDMGPMGAYRLFATGGEAAGGMMTKPPELPCPFWAFYVNVPALDAALERARAGGGQVLNGPMEVPGGSWIANCLDPQGAAFSLVAPQR